MPRDRYGSFSPQIVPKHARRLEGFDEAIVSLYAKGLTIGEIQAHLADIYGWGWMRWIGVRGTPPARDLG